MSIRIRPYIAWVFLAALLLIAGCAKKQPVASAPPPPPPPAPTASLSANPDSITAGQSTQLTWRTENASDVSLEGIGSVDANGSQTVSPSSSTTYRLTAKGPGGTQQATARVTVSAPQAAAATESEIDQFNRIVKDVYFDYDMYSIRDDASRQLATNAAFLAEHPNLRFTVEGHCDERGSTEYNLALGDNRATAVRDALSKAGVRPDRIKTISYGKEKPFCTQSSEDCWQQNRRGHFVLQR